MVMTYTKPAVRNAWADTAIPTTDIVDPGNAFVTEGWLQTSQPPQRQYFNWLLNWSAAAVRYFCQTGVSAWDATETYQQNGIAQHGGIVYQSVINNNTGNTPSTLAGTSWAALNGYVYSPSGGAGGVNNIQNYVLTTTLTSTLTAYVTQTSLTSQLANFVTNASLASQLTAFLTIASAAATYVTQTSLASQLTAFLTIASANSTFAKLISPAFSGIPTAPTAASGTSTTQIATTAFATGTFALPGSGPGFIKFPNGLIVQFGIATLSTNSPQSITFPIAFPTQCISITATSNVIQGTVFTSGPFNSNTGFSVTNGAGAGGALTSWVAWGH